MHLPFSVAFIFLGLPFLGVVTVILMVAKSKIREEKLFQTGIRFLKSLRLLLTYVQKHRGLSNSYLSGNTQIYVDILEVQSLVKQEIAAVESIDESITLSTKWESILDHWSRLVANYQIANAEYNLKQHNILIANLLYLIDDVAYDHHLGKYGVVDETDTDWRYLLSIAEYIGQARALGMGAVSRGECSSSLRIQLNHLRSKIIANIKNEWADSTLQDFKKLIQVIDEEVVIERPTISPADYFKLATVCIDDVLYEFDKQIEKMQFHRT